MNTIVPATFQLSPQPTTFLVNVIHVQPGRQDDAFLIIKDIVQYVSSKDGFLWSNLSKSVDGLTVVNIEAIASENEVDKFFEDETFAAKFSELEKISSFEYHIYNVGSIILPSEDAGSLPPSREEATQ